MQVRHRVAALAVSAAASITVLGLATAAPSTAGTTTPATGAAAAAPVWQVAPAARSGTFWLIMRSDTGVCAITHGQGTDLTPDLTNDGNCANWHEVDAPNGVYLENANGHGARERTNHQIEEGNGSPAGSDTRAQWFVTSEGIANVETGENLDNSCDCAGAATIRGFLPGTTGAYRFQES